MARKLMLWKTKGMNLDLSVSAFNPEFSFENRNLRLSTNEGNTLLSWVNEKGTSEVSLWSESTPPQLTTISGVPVGSAVINNNIVLFTVNGVNNYIYKLYYNGDHSKMLCKELYHGALGFDTDYPLETLVSYESDDAQKVYWTDGVNQPRVINIANTDRVYDVTSFDFIPELPFNETVKVVKLLGANGMFAPGVIQYAFTYFYKYGQETNIFYTTPLYYVSPKDRGGSPEEKVDNAFKITVEINANSAKFDYIRIYSIQRTSINGTPIVKRIQDIKLTGLTTTGNNPIVVSYTDTGTTGDTIDPTELLYKGGESIKALTMEQKDGTLFLGNLETKKSFLTSSLRDNIQSNLSINTDRRIIKGYPVMEGAYFYYSQLIANPVTQNGNSYTIDSTRIVPCGGFKYGDYYRLGLQFQDKTGKWSEPVEIWHKDIYQNKYDWQQDKHPEVDANNPQYTFLPIFKSTINSTVVSSLYNADYRAARPVVVFPSIQDRLTVCQGVACPTVFTNTQRGLNAGGTLSNKGGDLYAQASWLFRPRRVTSSSSSRPTINESNGSVAPVDMGLLHYLYRDVTNTENNTTEHYLTGTDTTIRIDNFRDVEIQGCFNMEDQFRIDEKTLTLHSPDIEFDDQLYNADYSSFKCLKIGFASFDRTLSDIDIQTETPTISDKGGGFVHKSMLSDGARGIISGLFYDDYIVDDNPSYGFMYYDRMYCSVKWPVYLWQQSGSLNNDINRPADKGVASALLKKKVVSNLRYSNSIWCDIQHSEQIISNNAISSMQLFASDDVTILKDGDRIYKGNIDTMLNPSYTGAFYFSFKGNRLYDKNIYTDFLDELDWRIVGNYTGTRGEGDDAVTVEQGGIEQRLGNSAPYSWNSEVSGHIGDDYADLAWKKTPIRMRYKSTPHLVFTYQPSSGDSTLSWLEGSLPIIDIRRDDSVASFHANLYGGKSEDSLRGNVWLPAGEPVVLNSGTSADVKWEYGDTYYQRWDCLKTYPFTKEDVNQVVEIGSFMLETRVNIDGRYDRNRGQINNLNMSPQNFNLLNPVYSQLNNFFTYRITEIPDANTRSEDTVKYPNYITWSKTKEAGADVDLWTNITMASVLELDGNMGSINKIARLNDQIIVFQDSGVSQVLYNENVQISTVDGVPIEIANSGKVQGKRYLSNTVGCSNKWSVVNTSMGIYFIDSNEKAIYLLNGKLQNISLAGGFNSWCKQHIPSSDVRWEPIDFGGGTGNYVGYYDRMNQDVLFIGTDEALAYSERVGAFTSFYDYGGTPYLVNLNDEGFWLRSNNINTTVWKHQGSDTYCKFFGVNKPYSMMLVGNPEPLLDKIFTNLEFRACVNKDGIEDITGKYNFYLPFDSLEVWNEYLHGYTLLSNKLGHSAMVHYDDSSFSLKRKFRIWRCDIPRNNYELLTYPEREEGETEEHYLERVDAYNDWLEGEAEKGIYRHSRKPLDRMRNPWIYIKLQKEADDGTGLPKAEVHDIVMTYFK